ncbi:polysaccharide pyruvyl transferase family protein [Paenibacillus sp. OK076]|uniref:polysaccharide pyruvyl transferase family protein n=1 Tax=Paenibacillus sp. OK076 TaxID=1884379 RepID=UPI0008C2EE9B|nr:polysaccharide pyruvyl transferase family protein [Paenibacillus sp. OK076]SEM87044.1 pyruvyl transferase EpsO [Paenibacillus sp. OK076]
MSNVQTIHPMDELKKRLESILDVIPSNSKIYYIDYPVHSNCGDLLIMKGTETFFKDHRIHVTHRYSVYDFDYQIEIPRDQIIVLHGGGNFGDLYEAHQKLRENIVQHYPNHKIVILPQTIFYKDQSALHRTAAIFNKHPDLHIYVRDETSFQIASHNFTNCQVALIPDMAHQLWPIDVKHSPRKEKLNFFRTDIEQISQQSLISSEQKGDYLDWPTLYNRYEKKFIYYISKGLKKRASRAISQFLWMKYSDYLVNKAIRCFADYRMIHSSRLHGHILSCLMAKPNVLIDNSYGKNSGYYSIWTHEVNTANMDSSSKAGSPPAPNYMETTATV